MPTLLLVEDDPRLGRALRSALAGAGYTVTLVTDGATALRRGLSEPFDAVLLDLMLPFRSGFEVLRGLRDGAMAAPILVLTARTEGPDKVKALDLGADDYVTKPFWTEELLARLRALLRRAGIEAPAPRSSLHVGRIRVDPDARWVFVDDEPVSTTPTEFDLLVHLAQRPGRAVRREQLAAAVLRDEAASETALQTQVSRLRRKLGGASKALETVWGIGYRLVVLDDD